MARTIKQLRNILDINQVEMAKKLNIPISTYNVYENGRRTAPIDVAVKIAKILGVEIEGAWARYDRKDKKPFLIYLEFEEHKEEIEEWGNHPSLMIQRKAEEFILKRAFPVEELLKDAEIKTNLISNAQQKRMFAISGGKEDIVRQALAGHGLTSTSQVPREKYDEICTRIEKLLTDFTEAETLDVEHPWR